MEGLSHISCSLCGKNILLTENTKHYIQSVKKIGICRQCNEKRTRDQRIQKYAVDLDTYISILKNHLGWLEIDFEIFKNENNEYIEKAKAWSRIIDEISIIKYTSKEVSKYLEKRTPKLQNDFLEDEIINLSTYELITKYSNLELDLLSLKKFQ